MSETSAVQARESVDALVAWIRQLESRIEALERGYAPAPQLPAAPLVLSSGPIAPSFAEPVVSGGSLAALGKALMVFGGAYLLRAVADSGAIAQQLGIALGLAYAAYWLIWSARPRARDRFTILLYGSAAALIFPPLLWENTVIVHALPAAVSAFLLVLFAFGGLLLDWQGNRPATSWVTLVSGLATGIALLLATQQFAPFTIALLAIAGLVEYGACRERWLKVRWLPALAANFAVFGLLYAGRDDRAALAVSFTLAVVYAGSIAARTIVFRREIQLLEIGQAGTALGLLLWSGRAQPAAPGVFLAILGAGCYCAAVAVRELPVSRRNPRAFEIFGLALILAGTGVLLSGPVFTAACCAFALAASRLKRFETHVPAYTLAAALGSGVLVFAWNAMAGGQAVTPSWTMVLTALTLAACWTMLRDVPAALTGGLLVATILGFAARALAGLAPGDSPLGDSLRIALLSSAALGLALIGRRWHRRECVWLVYPVMIFAGYRLIAHDFSNGRPANLAVSLALYGGTLWLLSRVLLSGRSESSLYAPSEPR